MHDESKMAIKMFFVHNMFRLIKRNSVMKKSWQNELRTFQYRVYPLPAITVFLSINNQSQKP